MKLSNKVLRKILTKRDRRLLWLLLVFSIFISIIESVGVSIIMPFIAIASDFKLIESNEYYSTVYHYFEFNNYVDFIVFFGMSLIIFYVFKSIINLYYVYVLEKFSLGRYHAIATRLLEKYVKMNYKDFVNTNSSVSTKSIITEAWNVSNIIKSALIIFGETFIIIFIYAIMLYMNY